MRPYVHPLNVSDFKGIRAGAVLLPRTNVRAGAIALK
jgi:hypothetical protein